MATASQLKAGMKQWLKKYKADPVAFVRDELRAKPTDDQIEIMEEVAKGTRRISVASGHGVGKTALCAWLCIWFTLTHIPAKTVITAPSGATLDDGLMAEIKVWIKKLRDDLRGQLEIKGMAVELKASPDEDFISARTARKESPDALQGIHSANVLMIADEASGIPDEVFAAAAGSMSGGEDTMVKGRATTVLIGNPVRGSGYFYDTHHRLKELWWTKNISCLNSPLVSKAYIEEMKILYGEHSNEYKQRVLGEFPVGDSDKIIPIPVVEEALGREGIHESMTEPVVWGLDIASEGQSAIAKRRGKRLLQPIWRVRGLTDRMQLIQRVRAEYLSTPERDRPVAILYDAIGMGGPVGERLKELNLPVVPVTVSELPAEQDVYGNLRAELWWRAKEWLQDRDCYIPPIPNRMTDPFVEELTCVKIDHDGKNKLLAESKKKLKARGVASPDGADAFIMTFAYAAAVAMRGTSMPRSARNQPLRRNLRGIV